MRVARIVACTLAATIALIVTGVFVASEVRLRRRFAVTAEPIRAATDSQSLARGRHVATAIAGCIECHGEDLGGRIFLDAGPLGRWPAPNLTTGTGGAAARMTDAELEAAIRHGVRTDGRSLHIMPSDVYSSLADDDVAALLGWLRHAIPVERELPPRRVGPIARALLAAGKLPIQSASLVPRSPHEASAPRAAPPVEVGRYVARVAGCHSCHGEGLGGGPIPGRPPDHKPAPNLTRIGLVHYDEAAFVRALRRGVRAGGAPIDSAQMPWRSIGRMTDEELHALWEYLRSMPPRPYGSR